MSNIENHFQVEHVGNDWRMVPRAPITTRFRTHDTVLNGAVRITPETRVTAEPDSKLAPGDLGTLSTGIKTQADIDGVVAHVRSLRALNSAQMRAFEKALGDISRTNPVGVTSSDAARASAAQVRQECDALAEMNRQSRAFWDDHYDKNHGQ